MSTLLKNFFDNNFKSSPKFGRDEVVKKKLSNFEKNFEILKTLLKERRFLYFTKKGPIEIVFNIKHYITALTVAIVFIFKVSQFVFFGVSSFFNYAIYKNSEINSNKFTESEIETLKNIAKNINIIENPKAVENNTREHEKQTVSLTEDTNPKTDNKIAEEIRKKFLNIKALIPTINFDISNNLKLSDEIFFEQFSKLASPELVPMELAYSIKKKKIIKELPTQQEKKYFSYKALPVIPFTAPRTNKLRIINFTRKLDNEIIQLLNVFKRLELVPDDINSQELRILIKEDQDFMNEHALIEGTSLRFQYLEELKNAIIYLPLKPPMQYYYVSSPYGYRIHPRTKKRQMHHGIDMAGTWQEEVRASADGYVKFSGRNGSFGKVVEIVHKHGVTTLYGHLHKLFVKKGDFVKEGDIVGKMGATGRVVGAHLHYEIKVNKKSVNPYNFINIGRELLSRSIIKK